MPDPVSTQNNGVPDPYENSTTDAALREGRIGLRGMPARRETREAFARAQARGDFQYAWAIVAYVDAGWERHWPYEDMPEWLKPAWWIGPNDA